LSPIATLLTDSTNDVKIVAAKSIKKFAKLYPKVTLNYSRIVLTQQTGHKKVLELVSEPVVYSSERQNQFSSQTGFRKSTLACASGMNMNQLNE
jgi:hypothetical protein